MIINKDKLSRNLEDYFLFLFFSLSFITIEGHSKKIILVMFIFLILVNYKKFIQVIEVTLKNWPLLLVFLWCLLSSFWSDWPTESRQSLLLQVLLFFICILVTTTYSYYRILNSLKWASVFYLLITFVSLITSPSEAISEAGMRGITGHKNNFGFAIALTGISIISIYSFDKEIKKKLLERVYFSIAIVFLLASLSKTSIAILLLSVLITQLVSKINPRLLILISDFLRSFSWLVIALVFGVFYLYLYDIFDFIYYRYDDEFLTGRGQIWMTLLLDNFEQLGLGLGFDSVWGKGEYSEVYFSELYDENPIWAEALASSDGGYTDLLLSLGVVGSGLFFLFLSQTLSSILRYRTHNAFFFMLVIYNFFIFHNITETSILKGQTMIWISIILVSCMANTKEVKNGVE